VSDPLAPMTRWQGMTIGIGLAPFAAPTARTADGVRYVRRSRSRSWSRRRESAAARSRAVTLCPPRLIPLTHT
jgi:hypothetical protein